LICGDVTGRIDPSSPDYTKATNDNMWPVITINRSEMTDEGDGWYAFERTVYDAEAWSDLWFYSNPVFVGRKLGSLRLYNAYTLLGTFIAAARDLIDFAGNGLLNTDNHPIVIFNAPRFAYSEEDRYRSHTL
jgi:hypothetical protein